MSKCPVCESAEAYKENGAGSTKVLYGSAEPFMSVVLHCKNCGSDLDLTPDKRIEDALKKSRIDGIKEILNYLVDFFDCSGKKAPFINIERILGIKFGTFQKWKDHPGRVNTAEYALLTLLRAHPELIDQR